MQLFCSFLLRRPSTKAAGLFGFFFFQNMVLLRCFFPPAAACRGWLLVRELWLFYVVGLDVVCPCVNFAGSLRRKECRRGNICDIRTDHGPEPNDFINFRQTSSDFKRKFQVNDKKLAGAQKEDSIYKNIRYDGLLFN